MFGAFMRVYINALMKGNPFAVVFTLAWVVAISVGPFYQGVVDRDPTAIGMMIGVGFLMVILLAVVIIDRKNNQTKKRPASRKGPSRPGGAGTSR